MCVGTVEIVLLGLFCVVCVGPDTGTFVHILYAVVREDIRMIPVTMAFSVGCLQQKMKNNYVIIKLL